jgi:hypothetical protein
MWHPFPGFSGAVIGPMIVAGVWTASYFTKQFESYNLDPNGVPGTFEPLLAKYIRAAEFIIGLATGSIVLLVGSSALHAQGGRLPWFYASPLLLLGWSVILGVAFHCMVDFQLRGVPARQQAHKAGVLHKRNPRLQFPWVLLLRVHRLNLPCDTVGRC